MGQLEMIPVVQMKRSMRRGMPVRALGRHTAGTDLEMKRMDLRKWSRDRVEERDVETVEEMMKSPVDGNHWQSWVRLEFSYRIRRCR